MIGGVAVVGLVGCQHQAPMPRGYEIRIDGENGGGGALHGVEIWKGNRSLGKTSAEGSLRLKLNGSDGQLLELEARCPTDFLPERQTLSITLRRLQDPRRVPVYRVDCGPATRTTVVVVRATNGADLPVTYLGRELARTDSSGVAHVTLTLRPGERYELGLNTRDQALSPKNPRAVFVAGNDDELVFFDQRFQRKRAVGARPRGRLPTAF
jgi:hypothetical protein